MEAANRGAREAGGFSVGCNIKLPAEQQPNAYLDRSVTCEYFFVRKVLLFKYSYAFVGLPGGIGTMDEVFEALTLVQTRKIENFPIVLIGTTFWRPLIDLLEQMVREGTDRRGGSATAPRDRRSGHGSRRTSSAIRFSASDCAVRGRPAGSEKSQPAPARSTDAWEQRSSALCGRHISPGCLS